MLNSILKLFRKSDPETSQEAAEHAQEFVKKHEGLIIKAFEYDEVWRPSRHPHYKTSIGMTKSEVSHYISLLFKVNIDSVQVCRRMKKLEEGGKVVRTELKRKNAKGYSETVWRLA